MKNTAICFVLFTLAASAGAQSPEAAYHGHGYFQFGTGGCSSLPCGTVHTAAGGGEVFLYRGLAGGVEGGYGWANNILSAGVGMFSANAAYHFKGPGRSRRVVPFVTGGYALLFRELSVGGSNWGGGATIWPANHVGLRLEGRLYHFQIAGLRANIGVARVGLSFR